MSKEIALTNTLVPAHVRGSMRPAVLDTGRKEGGREFPTISVNGREFTFIDTNGEKTVHDRNFLDVIIIDGLPGVGSTYYSKAYSADNVSLPDCWSNDGRVPHPSVGAPQAESCQVCPHSEKGSGQGGRGQACSRLKPIIVMVYDDPDRTLYRLNLRALSLFSPPTDRPGAMPWLGVKGTTGYVDYVRQAGRAQGVDDLHYSAVVTRLLFAANSVPQLCFKPMAWVDEEDMAFINTLVPENYAKMVEVVTTAEIGDARRRTEGNKAPPARRTLADEDAPPVKNARVSPTKAAPAPAPVQEDDEPPLTRQGKRPAAVADEDAPPTKASRTASTKATAAPRVSSKLIPTVAGDGDATDNIIAQLGNLS